MTLDAIVISCECFLIFFICRFFGVCPLWFCSVAGDCSRLTKATHGFEVFFVCLFVERKRVGSLKTDKTMEDAPPSAPKDDVVELNVEAGEGEKEASEVESHDASDNNIDNNEPPAEGPAVDFASLTKEEAKRTLSKKAYKEWKRQAKETKKEHHHHQHHHKDHAEKSALPKPEQKQRRRSRKESQAEAKPEEGPAATVDSSHNDDEPPAKKGRGELVSVAQRNDDLYDFDDPSAAQNPAQNVDLRAGPHQQEVKGSGSSCREENIVSRHYKSSEAGSGG